MDIATRKMDEIIARNPVKELANPEHKVFEHKPVEEMPVQSQVQPEIRKPKQQIQEAIHIR